jgi:nucleoside-diphosphate-sugar epimerase
VRRFVFISSIKVNGEERATPYTDADTPAPEDAYALSKWEAEQGLRQIAAETGLEVVILRPPLVYGPGVGANFLALLRAVACGVPLPLGAISNQHSLIYVGNLVDAMLRCIEHPAAAGKTFLVSDSEAVSTPELVRRMAAALGRPARLVALPVPLLRAAATLAGKSALAIRLLDSLSVDDTSIRRDLGWTPPFTLDEGLRETAAWYANRKASPRKTTGKT